jgi:xanthomonalisin
MANPSKHGRLAASVVTSPPVRHRGCQDLPVARLGGAAAHTDTLSQTVNLPAGGSSAELSFWLHIETEEVQDTAFDTLKVQIADEAGSVLQTLHIFSNRDASTHYERVHFDVTPFLGRRVQIRFVASEDSGKATSFFIDTVWLVTD